MWPEVPEALRGTRPEILLLDVDGVLTSNTILLGPQGDEWKPFHVPDGVGLRMLLDHGVRVVFVSGRASPATARRGEELRVTRVLTGVTDKGRAVRELLLEFGIDPSLAVFVGDDIIDLSAMHAVGVAVAVANAHPLVRRRAAAVTLRSGGDGAVREVCEWILAARGDWQNVLGGLGL